jgi:hypothetical protein
MLDSEEFLSDYGVRALSRYHLEHPYVPPWPIAAWSLYKALLNSTGPNCC